MLTDVSVAHRIICAPHLRTVYATCFSGMNAYLQSCTNMRDVNPRSPLLPPGVRDRNHATSILPSSSSVPGRIGVKVIDWPTCLTYFDLLLLLSLVTFAIEAYEISTGPHDDSNHWHSAGCSFDLMRVTGRLHTILPRMLIVNNKTR